MMKDAFDTHVNSQPEVVRSLLDEDLGVALEGDRPVVFTGIGTSLHACQVAATWLSVLSGGRVRASVVDAHDLAMTRQLWQRDQVVVVSHRGTKQRVNEVLRQAAEVGARSIAVSGFGPDLVADVVIRTCPQETASTHTVSYAASLVQLAKLVASAPDVDGEALLAALNQVPEWMDQTLALPVSEALISDILRTAPHALLVAGTGCDAITAREAALKLKEGVYRWAEGIHTEFALHGTPAVFSANTVSLLIEPAGPDGGRTGELRGLLQHLGAPVHMSGSSEMATLRIAPEIHPLVRPIVGPLPFHLLVSRLATELGTSPDKTHLEQEPWASAFSGVTL